MSVHVRADVVWNGDKAIQAVKKNEAALKAVGIIVQEAAKKLLTMYPAVDTGNLRGSITFAIHNYASQPESPATGADALSPHHRRNEVWIGTNVHYAPYVEFGTYKMRARPYLILGLWQSRERIINAFSSILGQNFKGF